MSQRLPTPGGDEGNWGTVLNNFLLVEHTEEGVLRRAADIDAKYVKPVSGIPLTDLSTSVQRGLAQHVSQEQLRIENDGSGNPIYVGQAAQGVATSASGWLIQKNTYVSGRLTLSQTADGTWDGRAALTYS